MFQVLWISAEISHIFEMALNISGISTQECKEQNAQSWFSNAFHKKRLMNGTLMEKVKAVDLETYKKNTKH